MKAIFNFFDATSQEYLHKELWELLKAALSANCWTFMNEPGTVLNVKSELEHLMEAFHLLLTTKEENDGEVILAIYKAGSAEQIQKERDEFYQLYDVLNEHRGRIKRLTKAEIANPYFAIKAMFLHYDLEEWKERLSEWVEYALSKATLMDVINESLFLDVEHLEKMLDVAYLMNKEKGKSYSRDGDILEQLVLELNHDTRQPLTIKLLKGFISFVETVPPARLSRNLRKIFMDYLNFNIGFQAFDIKEILFDLEQLFDLLDMAIKETRDWEREEDNDEN
ncbi:MAG: hypothetical protein IE931_10210 [Sphingobacteriales bacterium]|nr:hypothetical protein [Sphingobacteriales bacterium]